MRLFKVGDLVRFVENRYTRLYNRKRFYKYAIVQEITMEGDVPGYWGYWTSNKERAKQFTPDRNPPTRIQFGPVYDYDYDCDPVDLSEWVELVEAAKTPVIGFVEIYRKYGLETCSK